MIKKVSIIGLGYVGFPLSCAIAKVGYEVVGIDLDEEKIKKIKNKISPIDDIQAEKDIKEIKITVSTQIEDIYNSDVIILAVPTPVKFNKMPDLSLVKSAVKSIIPFLKKNQLIILESTVNPGVCNEEIIPIIETNSKFKVGKDLDLIHCPERINPGDKNWNVYNIPRNIGGSSKEGTKKAANFYRTFINANINEMSSLKSTEATKIIENTFRDINIAYVNELAKSFDVLGLDIIEVIKGASNKPFAFMAHYPGCGVGGHCIPVDPYYLIEKSKMSGFEPEFLKMAREVNNSMPKYTVEKLISALNEIKLPVNGTKIGLLGLSYKSNIADLRESPALEIKKKLEELGADLMICEPYLKKFINIEDILNKCEAVIIATNHDEFIKIKDWKNIKIIIDGRNCLEKEKIKEKGIIYRGIGRN